MMSVATAAIFAASLGVAQAQEVIRLGAAAIKTGPLAGGADVTHWPAVRL